MTTTHTVTESQKHLSTAHVGQAVVVGRHDTGEVHLRMTPAAAEVLAGVLAQYAAAQFHLAERYHVTDHDPDLWNHVAVDLRAAKAMAASLDAVGDRTVYASGYLPPKSSQGAEACALAANAVPVVAIHFDSGPPRIDNAALAAALTAEARKAVR